MLVLVERWLSMVYSTGEIELNHTSNRMMRHIIIFLSSSVYVIICNFTEMDNVEIFQVQSMWKYTLINGEARWIHWEKKNVEYSLVISLTAYEFSLINESNHILIFFLLKLSPTSSEEPFCYHLLLISMPEMMKLLKYSVSYLL